MNFNFKILFLFLMVLSLSACLSGMYVVTGVVRDVNQEPVANAKVEFYYPESNITRGGMSGDNGEFDLTFIAGGSDQDGYMLVSKDGFKSQSRSYVAGRDSRIEIVLESVNQ